MLIGFNNDVEYRGKEFHIQTEDHGKSMAKIESQIFHEGQILDTELVSYDSVLQEEAPEEKIDAKLQSLLEATHKGLYKRLVNGEYDEMVGLEPIAGAQEVGADPEEFEPSQDRVPTAAKQVEEEGEEAFEQFHQNQAQKHVDLDDLKSHLAEKQEREESDDEQAASSERASDEAVVESKAPQPDIDPEIDLEDDASESSAGGQELNPAVAELDGGREARQPEASMSDLPDTGVASWDGCEQPDDELAIDGLVESFLEK